MAANRGLTALRRGLLLQCRGFPMKNGNDGCVDVWSVLLPLCFHDYVTTCQICWRCLHVPVPCLYSCPLVSCHGELRTSKGFAGKTICSPYLVPLLAWLSWLLAPTRAGMRKLLKTEEGIKAPWLSHSQQIRHFIHFTGITRGVGNKFVLIPRWK